MEKRLQEVLLIALFLMIGLSGVQAQEKINQMYFDASLGGMVPGGIGINVHAGVGYQYNDWISLGVGGTVATENSDYSPAHFAGLGLEHRLLYKRIIFKNTVGIPIKVDHNSSDRQEQYELRSDGSAWFYRGSIGYSPKKSYLNFGFVLNYTRGNFNYYDCGFAAQDACVNKGIQIRSLTSPQVYVGLNFPKRK